ncbi:hypothetical protein [Burkholderia paludis]|uniref:hypothetical protein n=1 Tax=Burkholderia paludis TaxID=1506587 RepID=UPI00137680FA|nr:hypothetical protein [Burkholderia paludis]
MTRIRIDLRELNAMAGGMSGMSGFVRFRMTGLDMLRLPEETIKKSLAERGRLFVVH